MGHDMRSVILAVFLGMFSVAAWALDLDSAKDQGLVGERGDGYIGAVAASPSAEVAGLVKEINAGRRAEYQRIAGENSQPINVIEQLAAAKAVEKTKSGHYVMSGGKWVKKP